MNRCKLNKQFLVYYVLHLKILKRKIIIYLNSNKLTNSSFSVKITSIQKTHAFLVDLKVSNNLSFLCSKFLFGLRLRPTQLPVFIFPVSHSNIFKKKQFHIERNMNE